MLLQIILHGGPLVADLGEASAYLLGNPVELQAEDLQLGAEVVGLVHGAQVVRQVVLAGHILSGHHQQRLDAGQQRPLHQRGQMPPHRVLVQDQRELLVDDGGVVVLDGVDDALLLFQGEAQGIYARADLVKGDNAVPRALRLQAVHGLVEGEGHIIQRGAYTAQAHPRPLRQLSVQLPHVPGNRAGVLHGLLRIHQIQHVQPVPPALANDHAHLPGRLGHDGVPGRHGVRGQLDDGGAVACRPQVNADALPGLEQHLYVVGALVHQAIEQQGCLHAQAVLHGA